MKSFFIRHTERLSVRDEDLRQLWDQDKLAIHYPDRLDGDKSVDNDSKVPDDYPYKDTRARSAMRALKELADNGGYVWVESRIDPQIAKVGIVSPQDIEVFAAKWTHSAKYSGREGTKAALKVVRFDRKRSIRVGEAVGLRAGLPRQGTIVRWHKCGTRLADLIEGNEPRLQWEDLSTEQQEAACAEFLRYRGGNHPRLHFLLLPVGRTLKDVDIYGLDNSGSEVLAQVTYHKPGSKQFDEKLSRLKLYSNSHKDTKLVYFCNCGEPSDSGGVHLIPVREGEDSVLSWIKQNSVYSSALFTY